MIEFINKHKVAKVDCTEISVQRPKDKEKQKGDYSGKKKTYSKSPYIKRWKREDNIRELIV